VGQQTKKKPSPKQKEEERRKKARAKEGMAKKSGELSLLPRSESEFHSKEYWESFFVKRGKKTFEWYGDYKDHKALFRNVLRPEHEILVVGCGNSEMSASMYDDGFEHITNIDFSQVVIKEMTQKNRSRSKMKYLEMDMLRLEFPDASFDVVVDKGALDALYSDDKQEFDASKMFSEIARVLKEKGLYICITLAQEHILRKLLTTFSKNFKIE
jgi:SAM-dependent methyltransferase